MSNDALAADPTDRRQGWRKASFSAAENCVEVLGLDGHHVAVRDSKAPDDGMLILDAAAFAAWIERIKLGEFDQVIDMV